MRYFLDTNTVIDLFKERGRVAERLLSREPREIALSAVVLYELEVGARKSERQEENRSQIESLVSLATVVRCGGIVKSCGSGSDQAACSSSVFSSVRST